MAMSNEYFRFKQFRIEQGRCAMKVTTDACIQGAWTPVAPNVKRVLDIGTGTGVLALMLAQKNTDIVIDAIELDADATQQASDNVLGSLWSHRVQVMQGDVRSYPFLEKYDLIITNPPFFSNSLLGDSVHKNMARHTLSLSFEELLSVLETNLYDDGYVSILLPAPEYVLWQSMASDAGWHEYNKLSIRHVTDAPAKRIVGLFSKKEITTPQEVSLVIKDNEGNYTPSFIQLLSPFYLHL